jgi:DNA-binding winged helix-turn-helix (wHTH) protein
VLRVLTGRPGVVVGKQQFLREVWSGAADAHVVEVTVGRLRRRLGELGNAIRAVRRRGYFLERDS